MLDLQRRVGNRAVARLIQRQTTVGLRVTPPDEEAKLRKLGIHLPTVKREASDPRNDSAYIDNRLEKVVYGIYQGGYLLYVSGQERPLLIPESFVYFDSRPAESVTNVISRDYDSATSDLPVGPQPLDRAMPFSYYYAPGGGGVILPTILTPVTGPATVALLKRTVLDLVDHVERELKIVAIQVAAAGLARVLVPASARLGARLGQGEDFEPRRTPPPQDQGTPAPKARGYQRRKARRHRLRLPCLRARSRMRPSLCPSH